MMRLLLTVCVAALFACSQTLAGCRPSVLAEMLGAKAAKVEAIEQAKAEITVVVPADAEVFFDGDATTQKGTERLFFTPPLEVGKKYHYEILARWKQGGKTVEQTRKVPLTGGSRIRVDFSLEKPGTDPDKSPVVKPGQRMAVAKCVTENGLLVRRESPDKPWHIVENKEELYSSDLLVGGAASATDSLGGDIRLTFQGDL